MRIIWTCDYSPECCRYRRMKRRRMIGMIAIAACAFAASVSAQQVQTAECPSISVVCPDTIGNDGSVFFVANVTGAPNVKYTWSVSAGTFTEGQGTGMIRVRMDGERTVTATVQVTGLPAACGTIASCTIIGENLPRARKFDQYRPDNCLTTDSSQSKRKKKSRRRSG